MSHKPFTVQDLRAILAKPHRKTVTHPRVGAGYHGIGNGWRVLDGTFAYLSTNLDPSGSALSDLKYVADWQHVGGESFTRPDADTSLCIDDLQAYEGALKDWMGDDSVRGLYGETNPTVGSLTYHCIDGWTMVGGHQTYVHTASTTITISGYDCSLFVSSVSLDTGAYGTDDVQGFLTDLIDQVSRA